MRNIAIIPARSGSKGIIDKNIRYVCGKPLMAYTIEAAVKSGLFDVVHLSTDSEKYADIGKKYGADVPFLRTPDNASDVASSWDVVTEVIEKYKSMGDTFDTFSLLQPTSPLRDDKDILNAFLLMNEKKADAIVSVCESEHSPLQCNTLPNNLSMKEFLSKGNVRRQELETYYRLNGAIYLSKVDLFMKSKDIYALNCLALIMSQEHSVDIDSELDLKYAEFLIDYFGD